MIISFYSYKGGVGRTQLLANVASYLCFFENKKILIIDWDLEAPGLHYFFKQDKIKHKGVIDIFIDFSRKMQFIRKINEDELPFFDDKYIVKNISNTPKNGGRIDLITAGMYDENYSNKINSFNWLEFYSKFDGATYIEILKSKLNKLEYDYIFVDSRTGVSDYSGIVNIQIPDVNIIIVAPTMQNLSGNLRVANNIKNSTYVKDGYRKPIIMPVFSRVDISVEEKTGDWNSSFKNTFDYFITEFCEYTNNDKNNYLNDTLLDYKRDLSFGEQILFNAKAKVISEKSLAKQYKLIANYILNINIDKKFDKKNKQTKIFTQQKQQINYVFTFGASGVGKSTLLASLVNVVIHDDSLLFRPNIDNKDSYNYLFKELLGNIRNHSFPNPTQNREIVNVDLNFETTDKTDKKLYNFTFFDIAGEDFAFFDIANDIVNENNISTSVLNALSNADILLLLTQPNTAKTDDYVIFQFLLRAERLGLDIPIALIISKWDGIVNGDVKYFAEKELPLTTSFLKAKQTSITILPFNIIKPEQYEYSFDKNLPSTNKILNWLKDTSSVKS